MSCFRTTQASKARRESRSTFMNNTPCVWKRISGNSPLIDHKSASFHFHLFAQEEALVAPRDHYPGNWPITGLEIQESRRDKSLEQQNNNPHVVLSQILINYDYM